jgi:hypothetical protein
MGVFIKLFGGPDTLAAIRATTEQLGYPAILRAKVRDLWGAQASAALVRLHRSDRRAVSDSFIETASKVNGTPASDLAAPAASAPEAVKL